MTCPHCQKEIQAWTGFQEALKFEAHLAKCRKNPNNIVLKYGRRAAVVPIKPQTLMDALEQRAESGQ